MIGGALRRCDERGAPSLSKGAVIRISRVATLGACAFAFGLSACQARLDPQSEQRLDSHEAVLHELPRDFFRPGLGDLMLTLQARHAKLWYAGAAGNWELADFEMEEIRENLERVARWHAANEEIPMGPSLKAYMQRGRYALEKSITQRDAAQFPSAFDAFTEGCNACHRAAKHEFIVIERPTQPPYSNQRWAPIAHTTPSNP